MSVTGYVSLSGRAIQNPVHDPHLTSDQLCWSLMRHTLHFWHTGLVAE